MDIVHLCDVAEGTACYLVAVGGRKEKYRVSQLPGKAGSVLPIWVWRCCLKKQATSQLKA